ncbi:hypothetical protein ACOZ35_13890 [Halorubrum xinjiangense]|uniref:hypothetical protein n=1 Tax=Halorubrum xinjiangense TaxID=261291 RepID=UPI003C6F5220
MEDRGFNIQSASAAQQKQHPVTQVLDERFPPYVERSTRRPAFGQRWDLAFVEILFSYAEKNVNTILCQWPFHFPTLPHVSHLAIGPIVLRRLPLDAYRCILRFPEA